MANEIKYNGILSQEGESISSSAEGTTFKPDINFSYSNGKITNVQNEITDISGIIKKLEDCMDNEAKRFSQIDDSMFRKDSEIANKTMSISE